MASSEKFCLRWNDFESNVSTAFRDLREEKDFFDVTLACDDSSQVAAHKVILAACSPFFREVLRRNPHQHPLLYLKGVKYKEQGLTQENLNSDNKAKSFKSKPNISSETGGCLALLAAGRHRYITGPTETVSYNSHSWECLLPLCWRKDNHFAPFSPNSCNCFIIGLVYELMKYFTLVMSHKNIYKKTRFRI